MSDKKIRIAVLFGGKSAEHDVSIESAKNVYKSLDNSRYDVTLIGIDKNGAWHSLPEKYLLESSISGKQLAMDSSVTVGDSPLEIIQSVDVVFPVLHGTYGEDGDMQGFLETLGVPYVGSGVLGSAIGMDKDVTKRLLHDADLPTAKFLVFKKGEKIDFAFVEKKLGLPLFIKPANLGSSVGITKVKEEKEFVPALEKAFTYDTKIILEEGIVGREIECAVLGNDTLQASVPGEVIPHNEFYDYEAKYLDQKGAALCIPAALSEETKKQVQEIAMHTFHVLSLEGMARIDLFLTADNKLYVNEVNTIPGFTNNSMYPKLWEESGLAYRDLVDSLIRLALERYQSKHALQTSRV